MKNTIYNAIQKQLVIDDNDSSISYGRSTMTSDFQHRPHIDELYNIFQTCNNDIFDYDTSDCLTFILKDNTEISLHQYSPEMKVSFMKIFDEHLKAESCEILIDLSNYKHSILDKERSVRWSHFNTDDPIERLNIQYASDYFLTAIKDSYNDCNGYKICNRLIKLNETPENKQKLILDAVKYSMQHTIKQKDVNYQGYLPSLYQLKLVSTYISIINYLIKILLSCELDTENYYWSSTEHSEEGAWLCPLNTKPFACKKVYLATVFPFYKQM